MGLIHSRASKKRDKAEAKLLEDQLRQIKHDRAAERAGDSVLRQPTVRDAIAAARRKKDTDK